MLDHSDTAWPPHYSSLTCLHRHMPAQDGRCSPLPYGMGMHSVLTTQQCACTGWPLLTLRQLSQQRQRPAPLHRLPHGCAAPADAQGQGVDGIARQVGVVCTPHQSNITQSSMLQQAAVEVAVLCDGPGGNRGPTQTGYLLNRCTSTHACMASCTSTLAAYAHV